MPEGKKKEDDLSKALKLSLANLPYEDRDEFYSAYHSNKMKGYSKGRSRYEGYDEVYDDEEDTKKESLFKSFFQSFLKEECDIEETAKELASKYHGDSGSAGAYQDIYRVALAAGNQGKEQQLDGKELTVFMDQAVREKIGI